MKPQNTVLLTGAGFTHNFGTPLAEDLWAFILNQPGVQSSEKVRQALLQNIDFETVYHEIMEGSFTDQEKESIDRAVRAVYEDIDRTVMNFSFHVGAPYQINLYNVQKLINAFTGVQDRPGFIFTLNQDLFLERHYYNGEKPLMPGIQQDPKWFSSLFNEILTAEDYRRLPTENELKLINSTPLSRARLYYLKLHGSCNWTSALRERQMVIGKGKKNQIIGEPLLAWYFHIFERILSQPQIRLFCIGYGFGDDHINEVIADSTFRHGLKIYILSPLPPSTFKDTLSQRHRGLDIWNGLGGYFPYNFQELFPADQSISRGWESIQSQYFQRKII